MSLYKCNFQTEKYLLINMSKYLRRLSPHARSEQLGTVKYRRYNWVAYHECTCICGAPEIEDIEYILFQCQLYTTERDHYLGQYIRWMVHQDPHLWTIYFICGQSWIFTYKMAFKTKQNSAIEIHTYRFDGVNYKCDKDTWFCFSYTFMNDFIYLLHFDTAL